MRAMQLGLSHSLSRYKLKFSPDKVDTMVVQAVGLLDDLDKEVNTYAMRVKEWCDAASLAFGVRRVDGVAATPSARVVSTRCIDTTRVGSMAWLSPRPPPTPSARLVVTKRAQVRLALPGDG